MNLTFIYCSDECVPFTEDRLNLEAQSTDQKTSTWIFITVTTSNLAFRRPVMKNVRPFSRRFHVFLHCTVVSTRFSYGWVTYEVMDTWSYRSVLKYVVVTPKKNHGAHHEISW